QPRDRVRGALGARDAARRGGRQGHARVHRLGRRAARRPASSARCQGASRARRPADAGGGGRQGHRARRPSPSRRHPPQRRSRGHQRRPADRAAPGRNPRVMVQKLRRMAHDERVAAFLDPEVVSRLRNMELRARLVVEGFLQGLHRSPYHGFSVEFAEYRQYIPGDSLRYVDWKIYGKTDRLYKKMFEEETNLKAVILLDKSASMGFAGKGVSKLRWGSLRAAA